MADHTDLTIATHNGSITIENPATGGRTTIRIRTQKKNARFAPGKRIAARLTGPDNTRDYRGFAFVTSRGVHVWRKQRRAKGATRPSEAEALAWILENPVEAHERHGLVFHFETKCRVCNRKLTTPTSVKTGIGPVCARREADAAKKLHANTIVK